MALRTRVISLRTEDASGQPAPTGPAPDAAPKQSTPAGQASGVLKDDPQPSRTLSDAESDLKDKREQFTQLI